MQKRIHAAGLLSILVPLIFFDLSHAVGSKIDILEQKRNEISSLRVKIIDKIDQALEMQARLENHMRSLRDEIRSEQIRTGIDSPRQAVHNLRIRYNLNLIRILQAYVERLKTRIAYFQEGNEHLKFLAHQIKDDIAMIHALKDMDIDGVIDRVDHVLDEFIPETKKPIFDAADVRARSIERIWNELRLDNCAAP